METMTDKKLIEEMAKDIFESKVEISGTDMFFGLFDEDDHFHRIARFLYKHNYRKLPENSVVIPEKITEETSPEDIIKIAKYNETIRKETVRELLKALKAKQVICSLEEDNFVYMFDVNELAKQYGVEVGD